MSNVYSWGSGGSGVLLNGCTNDEPLPQRCSVLEPSEEIISIATGGSHMIMMKKISSGQVRCISVGDNDFGQLGHPDFREERGGPLEVDFSEHLGAIIDSAAGWSHNVVIFDDGSVVSWGHNSHGQCGFDTKTNQIIRKPSLIPRFLALEERVVKVACGMRHTALLTSSGSVYTFGENRHGQLGINSTASVNVPTRVKFPTASPVRQISLGARHSVFLCSDGTTYVSGCNRYGQCGHPVEIVKFIVPTRVQCSNACLVSSGWNFTILVASSKDSLISFGRNNYGQLGIGKVSEYEFQPLVSKKDQLGPGNSIVDLKSGSEHSLILTETGLVYAFGWNEHGQLGVGDLNIRYECNLVRVPRTSAIHCGGGFCVAITN